MAQPDVIVEINSWDSERNTGTNLNNQPRLAMNYVYRGDFMRKRPPHRKVMNNTTSGNFVAVGYGEIITSDGNVEKLFAHPNGKIWTQKKDGDNPIELPLSTGGNALELGVTQVRITQYFNKVYIVAYSDTVSLTRKALVYDGLTNETRNITSKLPVGVTKPIDIFNFQSDMRLGVIDENGEGVLGKLNIDVETDPNPFDTTDGAISFIVTKGNGYKVSKVAAASGLLAISKQLKKHRRSSMHQFTGTSDADAKLEVASPSKGFLGGSAIEIGSDILGLTPSGFDFFKVIQQLGEQTVNTDVSARAGFTGEIPDYIFEETIKGINPNAIDKIIATYNEHTNEVFFAVPYGDFATYNNLIIVLNLTNGKYRFSELNGTSPQGFFKANGFIYTLDDRGEMWKMFCEEDDGFEEEESYEAILISKMFDLRPEDKSQGDQTPTFNKIQKFSIDIESEGDNKEFYHYYEYERLDDDGNVIIETNRKASEQKTARRVIEHKHSKQGTEGDLIIADKDQYDERVSRRRVVDLTVEKESVRKIDYILIDDSTGLDNVHTIYGLLLTGRVSEEGK